MFSSSNWTWRINTLTIVRRGNAYCVIFRADLYSLCVGPLRPLFTSAMAKTLRRRTGPDAALLGELRALAAEILSSVAQVCTSALHTAVMVGPTPGPPPYLASSASMTRPASTPPNNDLCLLFVVVERLLNDPESVVVEHLGDTLKCMLDPDKLDRLDKERFLTVFYDYYIQWMLLPFADDARAPDSDCTESAVPPPDVGLATPVHRPIAQPMSAIYTSRRYICDIFSQCVTGHSYRMKYFIMRTNVISRLLKLLQSNYKHLHICALKFIRAVLAVKDEFYYRHIVKFDVMKPVFDAFRGMSTKDNAVTSVIIEIVDYIRSERIHSLISYIVGKHRKSFAMCVGEEGHNSSGPYLHAEVFEKLLVTHEQLEDGASGDAPPVGSASQGSSSTGATETSLGSAGAGKENRQLSDRESEEAYFYGESDSDEEDSYRPPPPPHDDDVVEAAPTSGYFAGLRSAVDCSSPQSKPPPSVTSSSTGQSSLALISELYDDMDSDNGTAPAQTCDSLSHSENDLSRGNGIAESNTPGGAGNETPPLPPLRPKYSSDDDDLDDNIFARAMSATKKVRLGSPQRASETSATGADVASAESIGSNRPPNVSGGTVSFSMTKKKQVGACLVKTLYQ